MHLADGTATKHSKAKSRLEGSMSWPVLLVTPSTSCRPSTPRPWLVGTWHTRISSFPFALPEEGPLRREAWPRQNRLVASKEISTIHEVFKSTCARGATAIDIGAGGGWGSLLLAGLGCHVTAVEPQTKCGRSLEEAVRRNPHLRGSISVVQAALARESGFPYLAQETGCESLYRIVPSILSQSGQCHGSLPIMRTVTLEEILMDIELDTRKASDNQGARRPPQVIRVSVAGYEVQVLLGAMKLEWSMYAGLHFLIEMRPSEWKEHSRHADPAQALEEGLVVFRDLVSHRGLSCDLVHVGEGSVACSNQKGEFTWVAIEACLRSMSEKPSIALLHLHPAR